MDWVPIKRVLTEKLLLFLTGGNGGGFPESNCWGQNPPQPPYYEIVRIENRGWFMCGCVGLDLILLGAGNLALQGLIDLQMFLVHNISINIITGFEPVFIILF